MSNKSKEKITNLQFVILIAGIIQGYILVLNFMDSVAGHDAWIIIIAGFFAAIPFMLCYTYLIKRFPGKNLVEILRIVYGKVIGSAISILYLCVYTLLLGFNLRDFSDFYTSNAMPETPQIVLMITFVVVAAYAVKKGISVIAKINLFSIVIGLISVFLPFFMLLGVMDFSNFMPIMEMPTAKIIPTTINFIIVPYAQIFIVLSFADEIQSVKKITKMTLGGMVFASVVMLVVMIRNISVLGEFAGIVDYASYSTVRMINIGALFNRVELITGFGYTVTLFIGVCIVYYAITKMVVQIFEIKSKNNVILPLGAIGIILGSISFKSTISHVEFGIEYNSFAFSFLSLIIPVVTLLIAKIRGMKGEMPVK